MDIWIFVHNRVHNLQMANNIVKWWKTKLKFLNGYKQFSVDCGDGKVSDTEELLKGVSLDEETDEQLRTACTTPPVQEEKTNQTSPEESPTSTPKKTLNFEEFSCDVSVENGENKCGQERQEFSFTLYDFDGHGKITKDDIAGLVTTIYEALGSSVKVPHYGSKTIKVKLTVSPDQRKHVSATIVNQKEESEEKTEDNNIRYKKDLNVTIRQNSDETRKKRKTKRKTHHQCCSKPEEVQEENQVFSDDSSEASSRLSFSSDEEFRCSEEEETKPKRVVKKCQRNYGPRYTIPNSSNESGKAKTLKKRSGSLQRQELLEIIQANMSKNNLGFQTPRKHSSHIRSDKLAEVHHKHQKVHKVATSPLQYLANIVDPTHFYVDLASLQNTTHLPQTQCQYDKLIDAVMCVSNKKISLNKQSKCRKHRSKPDISNNPFRYQFLQYPMTNDENKTRTKRTKKNEVKDAQKNPQVATGHTTSAHHLRHRNRQEDQERAMAQVVRWLEQEFSNNFNTKEKEKSSYCQSGFKENKNNTATPTGVEKHEHHHVHEHIHHHYHHYQDAPLLV